jgi:hypothetical protein
MDAMADPADTDPTSDPGEVQRGEREKVGRNKTALERLDRAMKERRAAEEAASSP